MNDIAKQPQRIGQEGTNRITIGKNWVQAMRTFAEQQGQICRFEFESIPGKSHGTAYVKSEIDSRNRVSLA